VKFINNIKARILTSLATVLVVGCNTTTKILDTKGEQPRLEGIASLKPKEIVNLLGAKIWEDVNERQIENYRRVFGFGDTDKDGRHSKKEYIENGRYMTPKARQGIFRASDTNNDGFVTEAEYVENRIITDEAKIIFDEMDADLNGKLTKFEFFNAGLIKNQQLAKEIFEALDTNNNGELIIPEYLRVWGKWARNISP
tara:strand:- start:4313 stop:4906 length:594 start_codon:yes stop_codon:yes gene_type:complete